MTPARTRPYFSVIQEQWQKEEMDERLSLSGMDWLIQVWSLAIDHSYPTESIEELMTLKIQSLWGSDSSIRPNKEKRLVTFVHQEGYEKALFGLRSEQEERDSIWMS